MDLNADQARFLLQTMLPDIQDEIGTTTKVLAALPDSASDWKPHEKGRSALELAWHIAATELWFLEGLLMGSLAAPEPSMPAEIKTGAEVAAWYTANVPPALKKVQAMDGESLARVLDFFGVIQRPAATYLHFLVVHSVHHRGQLAAYLRAMGARLPSIYGASADEPWAG